MLFEIENRGLKARLARDHAPPQLAKQDTAQPVPVRAPEVGEVAELRRRLKVESASWASKQAGWEASFRDLAAEAKNRLTVNKELLDETRHLRSEVEDEKAQLRGVKYQLERVSEKLSMTSDAAARAAERLSEMEVAHARSEAELRSLASIEEAQQSRVQRLSAELEGERKDGQEVQSEVDQQKVALVECCAKQSELREQHAARETFYEEKREDLQVRIMELEGSVKAQAELAHRNEEKAEERSRERRSGSSRCPDLTLSCQRGCCGRAGSS
mmetsp:Transcript_47012/g.124532  ORF Transcript_47012/g.124532 Transcript_47012/m.124532 type:complete len:272 (-) Transcript_47012:860-1675(-)